MARSLADDKAVSGSALDFASWDRLGAWAATAEGRRFLDQHAAVTPQRINELARQALAVLQRDPIIGRYVQAHTAMAPNPCNTEPWMAHAERLLAVRWVLAACTDAALGVRFDERLQRQAEQLGWSVQACGLALALRMWMATPYLWSNAIEQLVRASPLPEHVLGRQLLPLPMTFWSFETGSEVLNAAAMFGHPVGEVLLDWLYLEHHRDGIRVHTVLQDPRSKEALICLLAELPYGTVWPADFPGDIRSSVKHLLQRLAFVSSPYVATEAVRLPRAARREQARHGVKQGTEPLVHVVQLRRATERAHVAGDGAEHGSRDWEHHWWVAGHYRAQWHSSTQDHQVIWIAPHVKGPLDKPLLDRRVYLVDR
jgi:hypothetical protein